MDVVRTIWDRVNSRLVVQPRRTRMSSVHDFRYRPSCSACACTCLQRPLIENDSAVVVLKTVNASYVPSDVRLFGRRIINTAGKVTSFSRRKMEAGFGPKSPVTEPEWGDERAIPSKAKCASMFRKLRFHPLGPPSAARNINRRRLNENATTTTRPRYFRGINTALAK